MKNINYTKLVLFAMVLTLVSCKKNVEPALPADKASVGLNFYIASAVMEAAYGPGRKITAAYVDSVADDRREFNAYESSSKYPLFGFGGSGSQSIPHYPLVNSYSQTNLISYVRYAAGDRRIMFTDVTNTIVLDTVLSLSPDTWTSLYLADLPGASGSEAAYAVVAAQGTQASREGLTGIRFVNLSPDAGTLECRALLANGTPDANILATVDFREASEYTYLTQEQAANGVLRLQVGNAQVSLNTGVQARAGNTYEVIIRGFKSGVIRQIATSRENNGNVRKETVSVGAGIQVDVRRSY